MWLPKPGQVVYYRPTSKVFAAASDSFSGEASRKSRPCLVVRSTNKGINIAPLYDGEADNTLQADHGWWSPVKFLNSNIPVPTDSLMRRPIRFSYSADGKSHDYLPDLKPTFLWVGNDGEFIPSETAKKLNTADQYVRLEHGELERIQDCWTYCEY
ncbi:hypothetical protein BU17DRAFT_46063 [Hysterangium stoloniferum]|nr:hypothetical protein BU17DRAFT_46063 [Hysterangium stoloniferum]